MQTSSCVSGSLSRRLDTACRNRCRRSVKVVRTSAHTSVTRGCIRRHVPDTLSGGVSSGKTIPTLSCRTDSPSCTTTSHIRIYRNTSLASAVRWKVCTAAKHNTCHVVQAVRGQQSANDAGCVFKLARIHRTCHIGLHLDRWERPCHPRLCQLSCCDCQSTARTHKQLFMSVYPVSIVRGKRSRRKFHIRTWSCSTCPSAMHDSVSNITNIKD
jgi:hypothetical protein